MANFQKASLAEYGMERIAQAHKGDRMVFSAIGIGDGFLSGDLTAVTSLANEKQRFAITNSRVEGNTFWAECRPTDIVDPGGIFVREMGLYIADPDHEEDRNFDKLYSVAGVVQIDSNDPDFYVHLQQNQENMLVDYRFALHTIISAAASIIVRQNISVNLISFSVEDGNLILHHHDDVDPPHFWIDQQGYLIAEI